MSLFILVSFLLLVLNFPPLALASILDWLEATFLDSNFVFIKLCSNFIVENADRGPILLRKADIAFAKVRRNVQRMTRNDMLYRK